MCYGVLLSCRRSKTGISGLLTGSAFPQRGAIITGNLPCRKKPKALQNAPGIHLRSLPREGRGCAAIWQYRIKYGTSF